MGTLARVGRGITVAAFLAAAATVLTLAGLQQQGKRLLIVTSGSMTPAFVAGDVVVVESRDPSTLRPGMIVTFHPPGSPQQLTTHRILSLQPRAEGLFLQTKGDANDTPDPDFTAVGDVVGVATTTVPLLGRWLAAYQSPTGRLVVLGLPMLLLAVGQAVESARDLRRLRRRGAGRSEQTPSSPASAASAARLPTVSVAALALTVVAGAAAGGMLLGHRTSATYTSTDTTSLNLSTAAW